ncbi:DUF937 domain-containing protein [candidate division KSB1 bacterium]|nr:DUF937 domain-containing protein [candidate division KSB1 bacterium]
MKTAFSLSILNQGVKMSSFIDEFMGSLGSEVTNQLSSNLGIKTNTANQLLPQVIPMILSGLKKQKDEHGGEARVDHILNKYGSSSVLENIGGLFSEKSQDDDPDPQLGGLLGESGIQASNMISQNFGLNSSTAMKIIPMLAPVVLGALSQKRDQGGAGSSGIAALLDQDGDGSILDDVAGFLMQGFAGSGTQSSSNVIGNLLGGLFGKNR